MCPAATAPARRCSGTRRAFAGFSTVEPWLPLAGDFATCNVASQRADPASLYNLYRRLLALRRSRAALTRGSYRPLDAPGEVLAYLREADGERVDGRAEFRRRALDVVVPGGAGTVLVPPGMAGTVSALTAHLPCPDAPERSSRPPPRIAKTPIFRALSRLTLRITADTYATLYGRR